MLENNCGHALNYVKQFGKLDNKNSVLLLLELVHKIFHEIEFELRFRIRLYVPNVCDCFVHGLVYMYMVPLFICTLQLFSLEYPLEF